MDNEIFGIGILLLVFMLSFIASELNGIKKVLLQRGENEIKRKLGK